MPRMIFHVPYPLDPAATAASGIRPVRMRRAFEEIGFEVIEVTGTAAQRRVAMREVKRRIRNGERFDLVYSEASTKPTAMTEAHSLPTHPFLDLNFLAFCRRRSIPVGVFYRDIYWNEPAYLERVHRVVATMTRSLYRWDLLRYRSAVTRIFVPSMTMAAVMPHTRVEQCVPLPPGSDTVQTPLPENRASMFYVGALGTYYRLHETVRAFAGTEGSQLTICTHASIWKNERGGYEPLPEGDRVRVVHASGAELEPFYAEAALGCLFMEPIAYREFAAPMKLYEYLGHGRPIVATEGSLAGEFVAENGIGWVLPYQADALAALLRRLQEDPEAYTAVRERTLRVRENHTWAARARQAATALGAALPAD